ncbi:MAG: hypothetical protein RI907_1969 [Pseudomonadota bacterium]|jgi:hypothetical protein
MLSFRRPHLPRLALGLALAALTSAAGAQTSFTQTTLSPPSLGRLIPGAPMGFDETGAVLGDAGYFAGYRFGSTGLGFEVDIQQSPSRWAATTAKSTTPTRLATGNNTWLAASPRGQWVLYGNTQMLVSTRDKFTVPRDAPGSNAGLPRYLTGAMDDGRVLWTVYGDNRAHDKAGTWHRDTGWQTLPTGNWPGAVVLTANANSDFGGALTDYTTYAQAATIWRAGQPAVLDTRERPLSTVESLNNQGQALVRYWPDVTVTADNHLLKNTGTEDVRLWNGQALVRLLPAGDLRQVSKALLNNTGTVVYRAGRCGGCTLQPSEVQFYIWRDGQSQELVSWLKGKGVSLATGSVIGNVSALSDSGSLVIEVRASSNKTTWLRLTAKP